MEQGADFSALLTAFMQEGPAIAPETPHPMETAIRAFREALPAADNLGESHDRRDLYHLVDRLSAAVASSYPGSHCHAGCQGCCDNRTAFFTVNEGEWARIEDAMRGWSPERRRAFASRFRSEHGGRLWGYRALGLFGFWEPLVALFFSRRGYQCPFLEGGRCGIYAVRPLACRMYGFFALHARASMAREVYGCHRQEAFFQGQGQAPRLPPVGTVWVASRRWGLHGRLLALRIARSRMDP